MQNAQAGILSFESRVTGSAHTRRSTHAAQGVPLRFGWLGCHIERSVVHYCEVQCVGPVHQLRAPPPPKRRSTAV